MQLLLSNFLLGLIGLVAAIVLSIEIGFRLGHSRFSRLPEVARSVSTTMESSVFGLMGLLVAFTFYGAGSRFEMRRSLMVREANAIGTAYLRVDLLPVEAQPRLREDFRKYLRSRIATYKKFRISRPFAPNWPGPRPFRATYGRTQLQVRVQVVQQQRPWS